MQHETAVALHRSAQVDRLLGAVRRSDLDLELFEDIRQVQIHRPVDDDPHRPLAGVLADIGDGMEEIGILEARHGDEEMVGEIGPG